LEGDGKVAAVKPVMIRRPSRPLSVGRLMRWKKLTERRETVPQKTCM
jgi:hypothetical protein